MPDDWPSFSRASIRDALTADDEELNVGAEAKRVAAWEAIAFLHALGREAEKALEADPRASKTLKERHIQEATDRLNVLMDK